jgi:multiple sugar transport system substrate-binding protein
LDGEPLTLAAREWGVVSGASPQISELPYDQLRAAVGRDVELRTGAYDVVLIDDAWFPRLARNGNLAPVPWVPDDDFLPVCRSVCRQPFGSGTFYAVPYAGNPQLLFYRKDLFGKYRLQPPASWRDALASGATIAAGERISGFSTAASSSGFLPLLWAFGGDLFGAGGALTLSSHQGVEALSLMLDLARLAPPGPEPLTPAGAASALLHGRAAMALQPAAWIPSMDDSNSSKVVGLIDFAALPSARRKGAGLLGAWLLASPAGSKNQALAWEFIRWATETVQMKQAAFRGSPPARYTVFADIALRARYASYPAQLAALESARPRPRTPAWNDIERALSGALSAALAGRLPPVQALRQAEGDIQTILETENTK